MKSALSAKLLPKQSSLAFPFRCHICDGWLSEPLLFPGQDWAALAAHWVRGQSCSPWWHKQMSPDRSILLALGPTLSTLCQTKGRACSSLRSERRDWQRCERQDMTVHNGLHCHPCQQGSVPSSPSLGWHSPHGAWPMLPSLDPVVTEDGQN